MSRNVSNTFCCGMTTLNGCIGLQVAAPFESVLPGARQSPLSCNLTFLLGVRNGRA
jgi:hypothetical protein